MNPLTYRGQLNHFMVAEKYEAEKQIHFFIRANQILMGNQQLSSSEL